MSEIKPCPFCGRYPISGTYINEGAVKCLECHVSIIFRHDPKTINGWEKAAKAWNTRPANLVVCPTEEEIIEIILNTWNDARMDNSKRVAKALLALLHDNSATQEKI